jgi:hypothetical protein
MDAAQDQELQERGRRTGPNCTWRMVWENKRKKQFPNLDIQYYSQDNVIMTYDRHSALIDDYAMMYTNIMSTSA